MATTAFVACSNPKPELFSPARKPWIPHYTPALSFNTRFSPTRLRVAEKSHRFRRCSVVQDTAAVEEEKKGDEKDGGRQENRQKLYVVNLPWNFLVADINKLFGECGTVENVEVTPTVFIYLPPCSFFFPPYFLLLLLIYFKVKILARSLSRRMGRAEALPSSLWLRRRRHSPPSTNLILM